MTDGVVMWYLAEAREQLRRAVREMSVPDPDPELVANAVDAAMTLESKVWAEMVARCGEVER